MAAGGAYFGSVPGKRYLAESEKKQNQHRCSHAARQLRRQKVGRKECMLVFKLFLDKKFDKNQGGDALAKNEFRYAKMPELASCLRLIKLAFLRSNSRHFLTLHYLHFFNAQASRPFGFAR